MPAVNEQKKIRPTKATHAVGRHLLVVGDGGPDHCRRCGDFVEYLQAWTLDGSNRLMPVECEVVPKKERWWPQQPPKDASERGCKD